VRGQRGGVECVGGKGGSVGDYSRRASEGGQEDVGGVGWRGVMDLGADR